MQEALDAANGVASQLDAAICRQKVSRVAALAVLERTTRTSCRGLLRHALQAWQIAALKSHLSAAVGQAQHDRHTCGAMLSRGSVRVAAFIDGWLRRWDAHRLQAAFCLWRLQALAQVSA